MKIWRTDTWGIGVAVVPTTHVMTPKIALVRSLTWQFACFTGEFVVWRRRDKRPPECCGKCPPILGGGYDCTCAGNPRCQQRIGGEDVDHDRG